MAAVKSNHCLTRCSESAVSLPCRNGIGHQGPPPNGLNRLPECNATGSWSTPLGIALRRSSDADRHPNSNAFSNDPTRRWLAGSPGNPEVFAVKCYNVPWLAASDTYELRGNSSAICVSSASAPFSIWSADRIPVKTLELEPISNTVYSSTQDRWPRRCAPEPTTVRSASTATTKPKRLCSLKSRWTCSVTRCSGRTALPARSSKMVESLGRWTKAFQFPQAIVLHPSAEEVAPGLDHGDPLHEWARNANPVAPFRSPSNIRRAEKNVDPKWVSHAPSVWRTGARCCSEAGLPLPVPPVTYPRSRAGPQSPERLTGSSGAAWPRRLWPPAGRGQARY